MQTILALLLICGLACAAMSQASHAGMDAGDEIWDVIRDTTNAGVLQAFLQEYPDSRHAAAARARLAAISPSGSGPARLFAQPRQGGDGPEHLRVDWCLNWGVNCGKPAADAFCRSRGLAHALSFQRQVTGGPTWVAGDLKICRRADCAALGAVSCAGEGARFAPPEIAIANPTINHAPIASCLRSGECGQRTADSLCGAIGFFRATRFDEAAGGGPVLHLEDGSICRGDRCRAMTGVVCGRGG